MASKRSTARRNTFWAVLLVVAVIWAISSAQAEDGRTAERTLVRNAETKRVVCRVFRARCGAAWRVVLCESRGNPRAVGGAGERGLFQIHPIHFRWAQPHRLFDPTWNAKVAYRLSRGGTNWSHWTCRWVA